MACAIIDKTWLAPPLLIKRNYEYSNINNIKRICTYSASTSPILFRSSDTATEPMEVKYTIVADAQSIELRTSAPIPRDRGKGLWCRRNKWS
jgi:hypothetical protein